MPTDPTIEPADRRQARVLARVRALRLTLVRLHPGSDALSLHGPGFPQQTFARLADLSPVALRARHESR